jgi:hypothetical protein
MKLLIKIFFLFLFISLYSQGNAFSQLEKDKMYKDSAKEFISDINK